MPYKTFQSNLGSHREIIGVTSFNILSPMLFIGSVKAEPPHPYPGYHKKIIGVSGLDILHPMVSIGRV